MNGTMYRRFGAALFLFACGIAAAQTAPGPTAPPPQNPVPANTAEMTTHDEPATFKARVNLVMVPVVVRDKQGRAIGNLTKDDFQLFDKGKPQLISRFSLEKPGSLAVKPKADSKAEPGEKPGGESVVAAMPERFVAYLFDDIHLAFADLAHVRDAAARHIDHSLLPTDRAAIFTTSGQLGIEFTDDKDKLHETLLKLIPRPLTGGMSGFDCPNVSYYQADLIQNKNDPQALAAGIMETMACASLDPTMRSAAESMTRAAASRELSMGSQETRVSLYLLRDLIRRMAATPGQRTIILASPGFITPEEYQELTDVLDRAIRANVVINAIDARGLYTDPEFDASRRTVDLQSSRIKAQLDREAARAQADVLAELAAGTGGTFVENNNDLEEGFRRAAAAPEYYYVLGFSPQNLKLDGSYHRLKVSLKSPSGVTADARKGYYAPKHLSDAAENAKEEIREALFSREELRELPIDLRTQFFKPDSQTARVTVLVHVGLKDVKFRKVEGRNRNDMTIVAALFDRNGNYVTGVQKTLEMRLLDETLVKRAESGFTLRNTFDVKPGAYLIRLVVRDAEGQQISAQNGAIDIP
jgi:VWFA-related protein